MTKVWLVGTSDCEGGSTRYVCTSKEKALVRWEEIRQELIEQEKKMIGYAKEEGTDIEMFVEILNNLTATNDPEKMNNYPQEEPYMREMELDE